MAPGLITQNILHLKSDIGSCQIELCVGDITKLQREDKVDVLVVSAFPGDYSPTPSSLIGQLQIQLGISVRNLSKDKEEDLRKQYYCWWSKPLPDHLSYGRVMCFEGGFGSFANSPPKVIGAIFRCLVPVLKNKEGSVIMPLITTGDQGYPKQFVLRQVLRAAVNWMKTGLPLRTLKIVIFSRNPEKEDISFVPLFEFFKEFKAEVENKDLVEEGQKEEGVVHLYDIYISHCDKDHDTALQVKQYLQQKEELKVFDEIQELDSKKSWQDDIYNVMVKCTRVVTLLSPNYLSSEYCIEQYNMALCISRRKHKEVLAPFYVQSVEYLPTYMGLMQYVDCRPNDARKIKDAVDSVKLWLHTNNVKIVHEEKTAIVDKPLTVSQDYEVFISYSHCNDVKARQLYQSLKDFEPNLNVFIDTAGLKTGTSWQQSLFHAVDESMVVVALLSEDYFKSKVCKEEYSLAVALHLDQDRDLKLVTLLVQEVEEVPVWCSKPQPVDCTSQDQSQKVISTVAKGIVNSLKGQDELDERLAALREDSLRVDEYMQRHRKTQFVLRHRLLSANTPEDRPGKAAPCNQNQLSPSSSCLVALSFAVEDTKAALTMKELLISGYPRITISEPRTNATSRLKALDAAEVIIVLLSPEYLNSKELVEELNIALYRHRITPHQVVYPIQVASLPIKPTYVHLLPCEFSAFDYSWKLKILKEEMAYERIEHLERANGIDFGAASCLLDASEFILKRLTNPVDHEEYSNVLVNNLVVLQTWNDIREQLAKETGLFELKLLFGVDFTHQEENDRSETTAVKVSASQNPEDHGKLPVEQDELEQGDSRKDTTVEGNSSSDLSSRNGQHGRKDEAVGENRNDTAVGESQNDTAVRESQNDTAVGESSKTDSQKLGQIQTNECPLPSQGSEESRQRVHEKRNQQIETSHDGHGPASIKFQSKTKTCLIL